MDPFHVVAWAGRALDDTRAQIVSQTRRSGAHQDARRLKGSRFALWKNPEDLTTNQKAKINWICQTSPKLHEAYLLKEGLRTVFQLTGREAIEALDSWISWARSSHIAAFHYLAPRVARHRDRIIAAITQHMSNAIVESANTKIRLIVRTAYGFKNPHHLIALALLKLCHYTPPLPRRKPQTQPTHT